MAGRPRLSRYEHCAIDFRRCAICGSIFQSHPQVRRKYCTDDCSVEAILARPSNTYTRTGAIDHLQQERKAKMIKKSTPKIVSTPLPDVPRNPVKNTHKTGSIAFALLYGGATFSLNAPGDDRVGRGGGRSARQIGGPNV